MCFRGRDRQAALTEKEHRQITALECALKKFQAPYWPLQTWRVCSPICVLLGPLWEMGDVCLSPPWVVFSKVPWTENLTKRFRVRIEHCRSQEPLTSASPPLNNTAKNNMCVRACIYNAIYLLLTLDVANRFKIKRNAYNHFLFC